MYGGSTLLFYDATSSQPRDGIETIAGIECRVISEEAVSIHPRDLDRLADRLEAIDTRDTPLGTPAASALTSASPCVVGPLSSQSPATPATSGAERTRTDYNSL